MNDFRNGPAKKRLVLAAAGLALTGIGVATGMWISHQRAPSNDVANGAEAGREVLYWYDPMVPDQRFDKPGKSPFMDMDLVPRFASDESGAGDAATGVRIDAGVAQNLGLRLATVARERVAPSMTVSGAIRFNERDVAIVQTRVGGFVAGGHRRAVGDVVRPGDPLIDLRAPDWTAALGEYMALRPGGDSFLADAARRRLAMLGISEAAIRDAEAKGAAPVVFTVRAPLGGAITALDVREGMTLAAGAPIATINGLSPVWLVASVPQGVASGIMPGGVATVRISALAGETLTGRIDAVLPTADASSRAVEVRIVLPNPDGRLRPGMTAEVDLAGAAAREMLMAPAEAIIRTGRRTVAIVVLDNGDLAPIEITTGTGFGDRIEIMSGLQEGQRIVASGQFLIDSEASLSGVIARLQAGGGVADAGQHRSSGRVTGVDETGLTIAHAPIDSLDWPSMTMRFTWGEAGPSSHLAAGDEVVFVFRQVGSDYIVESIAPMGSER